MFGLDDALLAVGGLTAGAGLLGSFLGGSSPELKPVQYSPESLKSYSFNDISIARDNPELYQQLMQNSRLIDQANKILSQRSDGLSAQEQRNLRDTKNSMTARMAAQGLIGDPVAEQAIADSEAKMRERLSAQAYADRLNALNTIAGLRQQQYGNLMNAQNAIMGVNEGNRAAALQRDNGINQGNVNQYNADVAANQGRNQFFSGLLSGGLGMLGSSINMSNMNQQNQLNRDANNSFLRNYGSLIDSRNSTPNYGLMVG